MYRELVEYYRTTRKYGEDIAPRPPVDSAAIVRGEQQLGIPFPQELRDLLMEMDGDCDLLLSLDDIVETSSFPYSERYPVGSLLFFGRDGAGNLYGYPVEEGWAKGGEIVLWDHEMAVWGTREEEVCYQAGSIEELIRDYYDLCYGEPLDST